MPLLTTIPAEESWGPGRAVVLAVSKLRAAELHVLQLGRGRRWYEDMENTILDQLRRRILVRYI
jgi:hypothetical protein